MLCAKLLNDEYRNISLVNGEPFKSVDIYTFRINYPTRLYNIRFMQIKSNMKNSGYPLAFCVRDFDLFGTVYKSETYYGEYLSNRFICFAVFFVAVFVDE